MRDGSEEVRVSAAGASAEGGAAPPPGEVPAARPGRAGGLRLTLVGAGSLATWTTVLLVAATAIRFWPVMAAASDYDEGVYWQSLRAMAHGFPLFTAVFSSQPPLFLYGIFPFYLLLGQSLAAARIGVIIFSLVGIAAAYAIGRLAAGHWAGVAAAVLLALDPLYTQESRTLQAEVPALCWALVGVAAALSARRAAGARRRWLALAAGVAIALGIAVKLFDVVALVPAALYLAAPLGRACLDEQGRLTRPTGARLWAAAREALPDLGLLCAGLALGLALALAPFFAVWPSLYDQVVRFHLAAGRAFATGLRANVRLIADVRGEWPLEVAALAALGVAAWWRLWTALPLILWGAASLVLLLDQHPLLAHHVTLLVPPLAVLVGVVAAAVWERAPATLAGQMRWRQAGALAVVAALAVWGLAAGGLQAKHAPAPSVRQLAIADTLAATTQPGDYVLSDDQYLAALAGRDVPPQLVDTSQVRIASGYLTAAQLEQAAEQANVRDVLFASGRFDAVPGFHAWVAAHFTQVADFGHGVVLYARVPQGPVSA